MASWRVDCFLSLMRVLSAEAVRVSLCGGRPWPAALAIAVSALFGLLIGWLAWGQGRVPYAALLLPLLWVSFGHRTFLIPLAGVAAYMVATLRDLFSGAAQFFPVAWQAAAAGAGLLCLCVVVAAVWALPRKFARSPGQVALASAIVMVALLLPPLWILAPGHPITAYGFVWEGGGWFAVVLLSAVLTGAAALMYTLGPVVQVGLLTLGLAACAISSAAAEGEFRGNEVARAQITRWPGQAALPLEDQVDRIGKIGGLARAVGQLGVRWIVLPEGVVGSWRDSLEAVTELELAEGARMSGVEIWVGIDHPRADGSWGVDLEVFRPDGARERLSARQPMPLSLWRPWSVNSYAADWFKGAVVRSPLGPAYVSFCYEDGLPGFFLWEMARAGRPNLVVSVANNWFFTRQDTAAGQARHIEGMARLFGLNLLRAVNRPL